MIASRNRIPLAVRYVIVGRRSAPPRSALAKSRIIAFSASADLVRTKHFYHDVLGLNVLEENAMVIVFDVSGSQLRVSKVARPVIAPYTVLGWKVDHIVEAAARLSANGITFERFPGLPQDISAIATFPDGDRVAWFKDPEGHLLSLTEFGQSSKQEVRLKPLACWRNSKTVLGMVFFESSNGGSTAKVVH